MRKKNVTKEDSLWSEEMLLRRVRRGDSGAFIILYNRCAEEALRRATKKLGDQVAGREVVADTVANVWMAIQNGKGPQENFTPYFFVALKNVCQRKIQSHHRERLRNASLFDLSEKLPTQKNSETSTHVLTHANAIGQKEISTGITADSLLGKAYSQLPENWQYVLWESRVERRRFDDIGKELQLNPNAVSALVRRAQQGLKKQYFSLYANQHSLSSCREISVLLFGYSEKSLNENEMKFVSEHVKSCSVCSRALEGSYYLEDMPTMLPALIFGPVYGALMKHGILGLQGVRLENTTLASNTSTVLRYRSFASVAKIVSIILVLSLFAGGAFLFWKERPSEQNTFVSEGLPVSIELPPTTSNDILLSVETTFPSTNISETTPVPTTSTITTVQTTLSQPVVPLTPSTVFSSNIHESDFRVMVSSSKSVLSKQEKTETILSIDIANNGPNDSVGSNENPIKMSITLPVMGIVQINQGEWECISVSKQSSTEVLCVLPEVMRVNTVHRISVWTHPLDALSVGDFPLEVVVDSPMEVYDPYQMNNSFSYSLSIVP